MLPWHIPERRAVNLVEPKEEPTYVGVAAQVTKILRRYKRSIVLSIDERPIVDWIAEQIVIGKSIKHRTSTFMGQ